MKPEYKKNLKNGVSPSPSCYNLGDVSKALDDEAPINHNKDGSSFDLSEMSEALNNAAEKENNMATRRLQALGITDESKKERARIRKRWETRMLQSICAAMLALKGSSYEGPCVRVHGGLRLPVPVVHRLRKEGLKLVSVGRPNMDAREESAAEK